MRPVPPPTRRTRRTRPASVALAALAALALGAGCASSATATGAGSGSSTAPGPVGSATPASTPGTTVAVQKDVLATEVDPPGAPGRTLTLIRYTIAPGAKLSPHVHPGIQLAAIQSGSLSYTIVSGTATVTRRGGRPEPVAGPTTITLGPGDAVAEPGDMVHFGANDTSGPVVIDATLLTEDGKDLAVTVTTP